jgi:uncharacterized protein YdeI (YjbR/CyaY-like superfamily)
MTGRKTTAKGPVHALPADLRKALHSAPVALATWKDITPLAKNEWICWVTSAKRAETRVHRIVVACDKLRLGDRRPCCWAGCMHR